MSTRWRRTPCSSTSSGPAWGPLAPVGRGEWSRCLGFTAPDGRALVLRVGHHPDDFACDARAAAHRSPALPVPEVLAVGAGLGAHWAVCERVHGTYLEDLDETRWRAVLPSLLRTLATVRALPRPDDGGYGPWEGRGHGAHPTGRAYLLAVAEDRPGSRTHGWSAALAADPGAQRSFARGLARLRDVADAGEGHRRAVHADLLHGNVLVEGDRISGVIDWGCALDGDPVHELSELEMWAPWHAGLDALDIGPVIRTHLAEVGVPPADVEDRVRAGLLHTSLAALAYSSWSGDHATVAGVVRRMAPLLD